MFKRTTLFYLLILFFFSPNALMAELSSEKPGENLDSFHRFWPDNLFAVQFVNSQVGFIAGYSGTFLRTNDGGENWDALYIGRNEIIRRISFVDENTGWAVGHRGSIFHTRDGGQTWQVQKEIPGIYLRDVDFVDKNNGWVVGHNMNIWHTSDGGKSWEQQHLLGFTGRDAPNLHAVYAKDTNTAILVGEFGVIGHTENGGKFWLLTPSPVKKTLLAIDGIGDTAYVVGLDGEAVRLVPATKEQRAVMAEKLAKDRERQEKRARAKALRSKKEYVEKETDLLPVSEVDYYAEEIELPNKEHLFDVAIGAEGNAIAVGRSSILSLHDLSASIVKPKENLPLPYIWLGGVDVATDGTIWAVGIRGLVAKGDLTKKTIGQAFNIANSANVKLVSNRWGEK